MLTFIILITKMKSTLKENSIIIAILGIAVLLRFYDFFNLQYTFDELSALNRLEFDSFMEVIKKGVMIDAHPALIQVFLFYYTKLFGTAEWIVKLPFIICGIASVYIIYNIGKHWFNQTSGLLAATVLACSQFFVMYSTIARPYISGLFLCLLALKFWLEIVFSNSPSKKHYFYFALFACLSALNHHFSMMFVALCGIIGLFFTIKTNLKFYLLACISAVILYSPHFPVLLAQLKIGGIGAASGGWLDPPSNDFIIRFIFYVFHFSYLYLLAFIGVITFTYVNSQKPIINSESRNPKLAILLLFICSFLIGFYYSRYINPVIQFSTLIFSVPCLILFFTSFAKEVSKLKQGILVVILLSTAITTLIFKRQHYDLVFNQAFDTYMRTAHTFTKEKGNQNVYALFKGEPWFLKYYQKKYNTTFNYEVVEGESKKLNDYKNLYDTIKTNYLMLGDYNPTQLLQASAYFPYIDDKVAGYTFELYTLSKQKTTKPLHEEKTLFTKTNFNTIPNGFNVNADLITIKDNQAIYTIDSLNEYPLSYKIKNNELKLKEGQWVIAELHISTNEPIKGLLCASTDSLGKNIHFTASELEAFYLPNRQEQIIYLSVYVGAKFNDPNNEITFFVWNNQKQYFLVKEFLIYTWNNNPKRYGLLNDF